MLHVFDPLAEGLFVHAHFPLDGSRHQSR
jgi:hypothetical protein